jgi:thiosulfate/3-mercaptopyruvate sulfurtransferase
MPHITLVSPATLASHLGVWLVLDCRFQLADPAAGEREYAHEHLPGARYVHLDRDLSGARGERTGRHPLPEPAAFIARMAELGVGPGIQVVAYDDSGGLFAARLWWLLRAYGHADVAVLDGGLRAWREAGQPLSGEHVPARPQPQSLTGPAPGVIEAEELAGLLAARACRLIDVRAGERFRGEVEPLDPVAGHVPGAVNLPQGETLVDGRFRSPEELRALFAATLAPFAATEAVLMCGSGVTACHSLLAMELAGLPGARLYAGSFSEWCRQGRPVAQGAE